MPITSTKPDLPGGADSGDKRRGSSRSAWYSVSVLLAVNIINSADRQIPTLLVDPIKTELGISDSQMGLLIGPAFAFFYAVCGLPLGRAADLYSRRNLILTGLLLWSALTMACGLARNFIELLLPRMLVGIGEATLAPSAYSWIADVFPSEALGAPISVFSVGVYVGMTAAFVFGGKILSSTNQWRRVFFLAGAPGVVLAPLLFTLKEPRRKHAAADAPKATIFEVLSYLWKIRSVALNHNLGFAFFAIAAFAAGGWIPTVLMRQYGLTAAETGAAYGTIILVFSSSGALLAGRLGDVIVTRGRRNGRLLVAAASVLAAMPLTAGIVLAPTAEIALVSLAFAAMCTSGPFTLAATSVQEFTPPDRRALASSIYLFLVNIIGLGLGPFAVGLITDHIFGNEASVGYSLLLCSVVVDVVALALILRAARNYDLAVNAVGQSA